ncbi:MAG: FecR domain-containing protein [Myxococcaceae bacterium]
MSTPHLEHETLWSLARQELDAQAAMLAERHLADCADCRVALDDVKLATGVLFDLPPVPPMPDAMARRIATRLADEADSRAAKSFTSWWQALFSPRLMFVTAMAMAVVLGLVYFSSREVVAPPPQPIALPSPDVTPAPKDGLPTPAPVPSNKPKLKVTVASAKKATATKKQVLDEGAVVSTQSGGSLWMQLPDGSRAGLTSASEVTLAKLEKDTLTLDVNKGSLALVVPHREDRVLTVRAGELEVKDLGTRFLVSRESSHTVVAVEEGVVEVKSPAGVKQVRAGHAVTWREGKLSEMDWEQTPPPQAKIVTPAVQVGDALVTSVARLDEEDDESSEPEEAAPPQANSPPSETTPSVDQPPDRTPIDTDESWAPMPTPTAPPPGTTTTATPKPTKAKKERFSLRNLERKLREIGSVITTPTGREARARAVLLAADAGDCAYALQLADSWLKEPVTGLSTEASMKRSVQLQQVRCLNHLGRKDEATELRKTLEGN